MHRARRERRTGEEKASCSLSRLANLIPSQEGVGVATIATGTPLVRDRQGRGKPK